MSWWLGDCRCDRHSRLQGIHYSCSSLWSRLSLSSSSPRSWAELHGNFKALWQVIFPKHGFDEIFSPSSFSRTLPPLYQEVRSISKGYAASTWLSLGIPILWPICHAVRRPGSHWRGCVQAQLRSQVMANINHQAYVSEPQRVSAPAFELTKQTPSRAETSFLGQALSKLQIHERKKDISSHEV